MSVRLTRSSVVISLWFGAALAAGAGVYQHVWRTPISLADTLSISPARWVPLRSDGRAVQQSLTVDIERLDELCMSLRREGHEPAHVLVDMHARQGDQLGQVLWREVIEIDQGTQCYSLGDGGLRMPASGELWLRLRLPGGQASGDGRVLVPVTAAKVLRQEQLLVDGAEVWGDLLVRLGSQCATRAARGAWPEWLPVALVRSPGLATLLIASLWAAALVSAALWLLPPRPVRWPQYQSLQGPVRSLVIVAVLAGTTFALVSWRRTPDVGLIDRLAFARLTSTTPRLGQAVDVLEVDLGDGKARVLFTLPGTEIEWPVPREADGLTTAVGLRQEAWTLEGDGASFTILAKDENGHEIVLYRRHLDPFAAPTDRGWHQVSLSFDSAAPRPDRITFRVGAGASGNAVRDAALWREPMFTHVRP